MTVKLLAILGIIAAVVVIATAAGSPAPAHAQGIDDSLPTLVDLSIVSEGRANTLINSGTWDITVDNNRVGDHPGATVSLAQVEIVVTNDVGATSTTMWTIYNLRPGDSVARNVARPYSHPLSPARPIRLDAEIIKTVPVESSGFQFNNATVHWLTNVPTKPHTNGDTAVGVGVSDQSPQPGGGTIFTVHVANYGGPDRSAGSRNSNTQYEVQVEISLSVGLAFDGTPPAPSGTTFDTSTGIWDVGTLEVLSDRSGLVVLSLPVAVTLTSDSLDDLPLEKRCLTAKVINAVPWPSKTENDTSTVCLGEATALLTEGEMTLIDFYSCIVRTAHPCTSEASLELVATARRNEIALPGFERVDQFSSATHGLAYLQPEEVLIQVPDPRGRGMKAGSVIWSTVDLLDLVDSQTRLTSSWSIKEAVTVTAPGGGDAPGRWLLTNTDDSTSVNLDLLDAVDSSKVTYEFYDLSDSGNDSDDYYIDVKIDFWAMGTYKALFEISGRLSGTTYTDTGTYTFHVGPIAELEVRDGGASPEAGTGQRAYTVMAENNGPDAAPAVRVTLGGVPEGAEAIASDGSYTQGTCQNGLCPGVWTIDNLIPTDGRRASGLTPFPTLTLITGAAMPADVTATIENTQDYAVCINSDGEDVDASDQSACEATSGNSWHTAAYYDHLDGNNTETIEARTGTGEGNPGAVLGVNAMETPAGNILTWQALEKLNKFAVTHYQVERSASPWETVAEDVKGTIYLDTQGDAGSRSYRVRAVNIFGVPGPWSEPSAKRPGAPGDFSATVADSGNQIYLSWRAPAEVDGVTVTGYHLEFSTDGDTWNWLPAEQTRTVLSAATLTHTHTDDTLAPGAIRQYRVRAVGTGAGNAVFESGWVFANAATEAVGAPQNLAATADGRGRIDLTWDQPGFGADRVTGYRIDYTLASPESWRTLEHGWRASPRSYEHGGLKPGQEYCYRVAAAYAGGTGPFAARACATTEGAPTDLPGEPENLRVTQVGSNFAALAWDKPSVGGEVEYYQWQSNVHEPREATPKTATGATARGLAPGSTYEFQVRAGNSYGAGQWSRPIQVTLNLARDSVLASPQELEVDKGKSGSFNVRLKSSPRWPLMLYLHSIGPECLTEGLAYQQFKILLPGNPHPSKAFWEDALWGPPEDRQARPYNRGLDVHMDASSCRGGETMVVEPILSSVPFSYLEGLPMWDELGLNEEEWRGKWGVDPLDGVSGPSVKVTVVDDGTGTQQSGDPGGETGAGLPTAVTLALGAATVSESAGQVTITATLDAPASPEGVSLALYPATGGENAADRDADYTMPDSIAIHAGERSGTGLIAIVDDAVDEGDETVNVAVFADTGFAVLAADATLTITDDDTAGVTVNAASPLEVDEGGIATYTVVLDSRPTADVTIAPVSGDGAKVSVSPRTHTFTPSAWNTPLTFTVRGDADDDSVDERVAIGHGVISADARYAAVAANSLLVAVADTTEEQQQVNQAPTVASAIGDATIVNESGTREVSLSGVFSDGDGDSLAISANSSDEAVATVSVAADYSTLTVLANGRGTAAITVTAADGRGGTVGDAFTVTVKAAPVVASAIADMSLEEGSTQDVVLSAVFSDGDGDSLTFAAEASDFEAVEAWVFQGTLTVIGVADGSATITVAAEDADGNVVSDSFEVSVAGPPPPVANLSCVAETGRVAFLWDAPEWSGGETYAYDYQLSLPGGRSEGGRIIGSTLLYRPGQYQVGGEASVSVKAVYELADKSEVSSAAETLTCTVAE